MKDFVLFAILGLGAGSVYAMLGLGLVLVYRGSGVVNFAHGAIAMFAAYEYVDLTGRGMGRWPALVVTLSLSLVAGAILYSALFRRLRRAPRLAQLVATLGVLLALQSGAPLLYGTDTKSPVALLPSDPVDVFGVRFGQDRLWLLGITVVLASMLWALYRFTRFGVATQAAAESEEGAVLLGYSPDAIGVANWGLGCALAAAAGILVSPITSLSATTFTLLIIPALAAALIGRFSSFSLVAVTGIGIGVVQSLVTGGQIGLPDFVPQQGLKETLPFLVIIVAMVVTGALIPNRGALGEGRPPFATSGRVRPVTVAVAVAAVIGLLVLFEGNNVYQSAIMVSMIAAIVALSLVVVTGFVGQISLAQMTFAGIGGFAAAKLTAALGVPILVSIVLAALIAVPIGLLIGLPALRVRGVNLAVLTIGAAVAIDNFVFQNSDWSGGIDGLNLPEPNLFGWSLSASAHPQRFGAFVAIVLTALALAVCALRRSPTGHRMLAVRDNERAAAASGVNVAATKLQAFAVAAAIASVAGTLTAYQYGRFASMRFFPVASIFFVAIAYIGGIASTSGALVAGTLASGGLAFTVLGELGDLAQWQGLISGVVLIIIVITQPDGISVAASRVPAAVRAAPCRTGSAGAVSRRGPGAGRGRRAMTPLLSIDEVSVGFGGVRALDRVTMTVEPGTLVGLIGPNGAGKTTLVDALTGFVPVSNGDIHFAGEQVTRMSPHRLARRGLCRTFQSVELFEDLTVRENLDVSAEPARWHSIVTDALPRRRRHASERVAWSLELLGLTAHADLLPGTLSQGQRKLVGVAARAVERPEARAPRRARRGSRLRGEPGVGGTAAGAARPRRDRAARRPRHGPRARCVRHDLGAGVRQGDRARYPCRGPRRPAGRGGVPRSPGRGHGRVRRRRTGRVVTGVAVEAVAPVDPVARERGPVVEVCGLTAGYRGIPVVRDLDLHVHASEVVALLGPNGAGKTTILRTISGILPAISGEVRVLGEPVSSHRPHRNARRGLAHVPSGRALFFGLSARANLQLGNRDRKGDVAAALDYFPQLRSLLTRRAGLLSGGEQQMLALARARQPAEGADGRRDEHGPGARVRREPAPGAPGHRGGERDRDPAGRAARAHRARDRRPGVRPHAREGHARRVRRRAAAACRPARGELSRIGRRIVALVTGGGS